MSIKTRLALLLGFLLLGFLATWLVTREIERREKEQMLADARRSRVLALNHWIDLTGRSLPQFASEFAQAGELTSAMQGATPEFQAKIAGELQHAGVAKMWLLQANGAPRLAINAAQKPENEPPPLLPQEFAILVEATPNPHFYSEQKGTLLELSVRRLGSPSASGQTGWLMLAREWDETHLKTLAELTESNISLLLPTENSRPEIQAAQVVVLRPLADWKGHEIRVLRVEHAETELANMAESDVRTVRVFLLFGLLVITAVGLSLQIWVLRPLKRIGESLARKDPGVLDALKTEGTEFGHVARLVEFSFQQTEALRKNEEALRHTMEERARLGWNLHDGVIQSLYAAGMGLAGVRAQLGPEQNVAARHLEQVRGILNETIHDVRNFITGLEPEALKQQTFGQAVGSLLATMQSVRRVRTTLNIDEPFAERLSLPQRVHLLQIVREAVSNALRHGQATHIAVTLHAEAEPAEFEVVDDGRGFDPAVPSQGKGLANIAERARALGATLAVLSTVGKGTRVKLVFSSLSSHD
ncbi:MAG: sensor histidine kinase [Opitutaceae bacterium]